MKVKLYTIIILLVCVQMTYGQAENFLNKIESRIDSCFVASFHNKKAYEQVEQQLMQNYRSEKSVNMKYYYYYWISYLKYYQSLSAFKTADLGKAEKYINEAINYINKMAKKDSEAYCLLAYEQIFNFQFVPRKDMFVYMRNLDKSLRSAIELDKSNPRGYYVNGYYDFYTPKEYGGKKKTEAYLLKAISLRSTGKPYAPKWGYKDSYAILIQYYIEKGAKEKAQKIFKNAQQIFPNTPEITRFKKVLQP